MPDFVVTSQGKKFKITAPDQNTAMKAFASLNAGSAGPQVPAVQGGKEVIPETDPRAGLPLPGTMSQAEALGQVKDVPTRTFGTSSADTLNPIPAIEAYTNQFVKSVPVAGPTLESMGNNFDAALDNLVYRPLTGAQGTTSPQDVSRENQANIDANPGFAQAGAVSAPIASYMLLSKLPGGATALGLEGSTASRIGFGLPSSFAINAGDEVAHGKSVPDALLNSIIPTAAAAPFLFFGGRGKVADAVESAGLTPQQVNAEVARLGPGAVVADAAPSLQALTAAAARGSGPTSSRVTTALMERAAAANSRIRQGTGNILGAEPIPSRVLSEIDARRMAANEGYKPVLAEKALSGATPAEAAYDAAPLAKMIDDTLPNLVGETRSQVQKVRDMLTNPQTGELVTDPQTILSIRGELDGVIGSMKDQRGNKTTISALGDLRKQIDDDLAYQVPGIKWADASRAAVAREGEGFDLGREALQNGGNAIHPQDFTDKLAELAGPAGTAVGPRQVPALAPQRVNEGMLSRIYQAIGVTANDRVALKQLLKGDGSWNRDKIATAFGEDKARQFIGLLDAEATMARTENLAYQNSATSTVQAAKEALDPSGKRGALESALNLDFGSAAHNLIDKATGGITQTLRERRNSRIADALLARGLGPMSSGLSPTARLVPMVAAQQFASPVVRALLGGGQ